MATSHTPIQMPPYRYVAHQWRKRGLVKDPHVSVVLDALALMIDAVAGQVIRQGMVPYFDNFRSTGYREIEAKLSVVKRELHVVHYPTSAQVRDLSTANQDGVLVEMTLSIAAMGIVGLPAWGPELLMAESADVPELLWSSYLANAVLAQADGKNLLERPLQVGTFNFGSQPYAGSPIGWMTTLTAVLTWQMKNWLFGD